MPFVPFVFKRSAARTTPRYVEAMSQTFHAYAATEAKGDFKPFEYDPGELGPDEVEIEVSSCGICHSDLSMLDNDWGMTKYPFVGGHEATGKVAAVGEHVPADKLQVGDTVGAGWISSSCFHCRQCLAGDQNLCPDQVGMIVGRHGAFADRVRAHWGWTTKLPEGVSPADAGPLFCGGITVFNPIVQNHVQPTDRVAVIGIGGLGHLALQFLDAWGCDVTAISTTPDKEDEAKELGADHFLNAKEDGALQKHEAAFDFVLNTTNAALDWDAYAATLAPKGTLHTVGVVEGSWGVEQVFPMISQQRSLTATPLGSPATVHDMLGFCARHGINAMTEHFAMADLNDAFEKLRSGSPRYRLVLDN